MSSGVPQYSELNDAHVARTQARTHARTAHARHTHARTHARTRTRTHGTRTHAYAGNLFCIVCYVMSRVVLFVIFASAPGAYIVLFVCGVF